MNISKHCPKIDRKNTHTPNRWQSGNFHVWGGVDGSGNPGRRGDGNLKILPQGDLLTLISINIF